ncbi:acylphosphatase [Patescibacteria group bacterium]|nr:acylphosphatase [Patescibacteria group bacterium]
MKHLHLKIHGHVQGINFRYYTREKAKELGLTGYVKNLPDGTVEVVVEGEEEVLKNMLEWCKIGPRHARVEKVGESWNDGGESEFETFKIVY